MVCLGLPGSLIDFLQEKPVDWSQCGENEARLGFSLQGLEALVRMTSDEMATDHSQVEKEGPRKVPAGAPVLRVAPSVSALRPCRSGFKP